MRDHIYDVELLNVGGSLEALLYSYITETPIIIDEPRRPFELEDISSTHDFSLLGFNESLPLKAVDVWDRLCFLLSMGGLLLFPNNIQNLRSDDNSLIVTTHNNKRATIRFSECKQHDLHRIGYSWVYDWFNVRSGGKHNHDYLEDKDNFLVKRLQFYQSSRSNVNTSLKDAVAVSFIKDEEVNEIENSDSYARLKALSMMKAAGIRGTRNGYDRHRNPAYYSVKIEHSHREIKPQINPLFTVAESLNFSFNYEGVLCKITKNLFTHRKISI